MEKKSLFYLYGLGVSQVVTKVHQYLRYELRYIVREGQDTGAQPQHPRVPLDDALWVQVGPLVLLDLCTAQRLKLVHHLFVKGHVTTVKEPAQGHRRHLTYLQSLGQYEFKKKSISFNVKSIFMRCIFYHFEMIMAHKMMTYSYFNHEKQSISSGTGH